MEMEAIMAAYEDVQERKKLNITSFFTLFSVSPIAVRSVILSP
jgi:hypothetical protein